MAYKGFSSDCNTLSRVVARALSDILTSASTTSNPYAYPILTAGDDTPTAFTTDALTGTVVNRASAEFSLSGTPKDWYTDLTREHGAINRCLGLLPYAATRTIWYTVTVMPKSSRAALILNY